MQLINMEKMQIIQNPSLNEKRLKEGFFVYKLFPYLILKYEYYKNLNN